MGTRSITTFTDERGSYHIYKHWDGYPENMVPLIFGAQTAAWELPRFEADEYAAAFVSTTKVKEGDVRIQLGRTDAADVEFGYTVTCQKGKLHLVITTCDFWDDGTEERVLFSGTEKEARAYAKTPAMRSIHEVAQKAWLDGA